MNTSQDPSVARHILTLRTTSLDEKGRALKYGQRIPPLTATDRAVSRQRAAWLFADARNDGRVTLSTREFLRVV